MKYRANCMLTTCKDCKWKISRSIFGIKLYRCYARKTLHKEIEARECNAFTCSKENKNCSLCKNCSTK